MMKGLGGIMKQAQKMQAELGRIQEEMAQKVTEASSGGGMVSVAINGRQEVLSIKIEPEVVNPGDIEMLQDMVGTLQLLGDILKIEDGIQNVAVLVVGLRMPTKRKEDPPGLEKLGTQKAITIIVIVEELIHG